MVLGLLFVFFIGYVAITFESVLKIMVSIIEILFVVLLNIFKILVTYRLLDLV